MAELEEVCLEVCVVNGSVSSSSGVSSCHSAMDLDRYEEEQSDEDDAFISFTTLESKCEQLYEEGLRYKCQGDLDESLSSFLKCLAGMQECQYFSMLPQTLHQLSELYQSLQLLDVAETYSKAEKLFYESLITETQTTKDGQAKPKTKRRPFGKKPRPASSSNAVHNPAEYGSILKKKAEMFEKLARTCAAECKFDLAQEYSAKATSIRQTVLGQSCRASSDYILCSRAAPDDSMLKGDLSKAGHVGTVLENETNGNTLCGSAGVILSGNNGSLCQPLYLAPCLQTENTFTDGHQGANIPFQGPHTRGSCNTVEELRSSYNTMEQTLLGGYTKKVGQESVLHAGDPGIHKDSELCTHPSNSMENHHHQNFSAGVTTDNLNKPMFEFKNPMSKLSELRNPMCNLSNPMSKLSELKKPMSKLSELKNPMCVNLDLHKGPGEQGTESTRCLPLWILLLPALLALVGYVMYYH